jgi:hypothetical protein
MRAARVQKDERDPETGDPEPTRRCVLGESTRDGATQRTRRVAAKAGEYVTAPTRAIPARSKTTPRITNAIRIPT